MRREVRWERERESRAEQKRGKRGRDENHAKFYKG